MNKTEALRYRRMVLEKGGSQDEMKSLVNYLGREPKIDSFYKELGIA
jgi:metallopeptidase MepB